MMLRPLLSAGLLLFSFFPANPVQAKEPARLLMLGDSLTAGYGLKDPGDAFPSVLQTRLNRLGCDVTVINAGITGNTTEDGLRRLPWELGKHPDMVIIELGANDMLRGIDPEITTSNLSAIITRLKDHNIKVLLAGMYAIPGLDETYARHFEAVYPALAQKYDVPLYPYFLEGLSGKRQFKQADGLHPNPDGVEVMVRHFLPFMQAQLNKLGCLAKD